MQASLARASNSAGDVDFQRASGDTIISRTTGAISGTNTASKYGAPTEILPSPRASSASGYSVPSITAPVAVTSSTLFTSSSDSREIRSKPPAIPTRPARQA